MMTDEEVKELMIKRLFKLIKFENYDKDSLKTMMQLDHNAIVRPLILEARSQGLSHRQNANRHRVPIGHVLYVFKTAKRKK